jgi:enoyl-CoA hydratase/carnithine racemase
MLLTGEPVDADRALTANLVSKRVAHDELMDAAEATVASILRNDQTALQSAKETLLDVIGRPLDDQLALEALYGYTLMGNPTIPDRLARFYDKTDPGRAGKNAAAVNTVDVERN